MNPVKKIIEKIILMYINNPFLLVVTITLIVLCYLINKYYPKFRGFMGEFWVKKELEKLPKNKYILLNNIMIKDDKGTHQIDHLVLSEYGIFVIEMKNYYGFIKGNEYDNNWYQYLGKNKYSFKNPIHQNYGHIKALESLLQLDEKKFISIICFSEQAKIKVNSNNIVIQVGDLKATILQFRETIIQFDIGHLTDIVLKNNIFDKKSRKQHLEMIQEKITRENYLIQHMTCPKCGNKLIEKVGRYGKFIGCSNYPKCRYSKEYIREE